MIESKGSIKNLRECINILCLQIIKDPSTHGIFKKIDDENLTKILNQIVIFDCENEYDKNLISLVIKLHVYEEIKQDKLKNTAEISKQNVVDIGTKNCNDLILHH